MMWLLRFAPLWDGFAVSEASSWVNRPCRSISSVVSFVDRLAVIQTEDNCYASCDD